MAPQTIKLQGKIQAHQVLILVDSGSSHSFVSTALASKLSGVVKARRPLKVRIADGGQLSCDLEISQCQWTVQGHKFTTDLKVLPLGCYDMIIGMDWLEQHSPMQVHWGDKQMAFMQGGKAVQLSGVQPQLHQCHALSGEQLDALIACNAVQQVVCQCSVEGPPMADPLPEEVEALINKFAHLFEEPQGLPPSRPFDHAIPLIPGAHPVNLQPYRYTPAQKDEIEKQIAALLKQGVVQHSSSPYASPVLLVQKKDGTWRLCVVAI